MCGLNTAFLLFSSTVLSVADTQLVTQQRHPAPYKEYSTTGPGALSLQEKTRLEYTATNDVHTSPVRLEHTVTNDVQTSPVRLETLSLMTYRLLL